MMTQTALVSSQALLVSGVAPVVASKVEFLSWGQVSLELWNLQMMVF